MEVKKMGKLKEGNVPGEKIEYKMEKYPIRPTHNNVFLIEQWCESELMEKLRGLVLKQ
jgi:hypothetical protein